MDLEAILPLLIAVTAALYATVGHAGASGYLALMALAGIAAPVLKPTALLLNLAVALISTVSFTRAGWLRWRLLLPFLATSIPCAFLGGMVRLPAATYRHLLAVVLAYAAWRLWNTARPADTEETFAPPSWPLALVVGAVVGLTSGLLGVGGGIFLSPIIMLAGWAGPRTTAATSATFILANSAAGLAGHGFSCEALPAAVPLWVGCAILGGLVGSWLGARWLPPVSLRRVLAGVLALAAAKMAL